MSTVKDIMREELIGHYVIIHCKPIDGGEDFSVEGLLERVDDDVIILRVGMARRFISNVIVIQVIDYGTPQAVKAVTPTKPEGTVKKRR